MVVSLKDITLLANYDPIMETIDGLIKQKEKDVQIATAKKIINRFHRYVETETQGTQTHDPAIEAMRQEL